MNKFYALLFFQARAKMGLVSGCFALSLLSLLLLLAGRGAHCSSDGHSTAGADDICISEVEPEQGKVWIDFSSNERYSYTIFVDGPHFLAGHPLMAAVHVSFLNSTSFPDPLALYVYDELSGVELPNDTVAGPTLVAASSPHFLSLGTSVWDVLTAGSTSATSRANLTTIVLPYPPCLGLETRVYSRLFQMILLASDMDKDTLTLTPLPDTSAVSRSQVGLFMPIGLLSLFLSLLLLPCFYSTLLQRQLTQRVSKERLHTAELSLLSTASLLAGFSIIYWVISALEYYCSHSESVDGVLFPNAFFSPMTQCLIFYSLAGLAGFIGGMLFGQCTISGRAPLTCCQVLGKGLLSACTTAIFFHSFFILVAVFQYPISVISDISLFLTDFILLFLALFAILEQYRKSKCRGNFSLVVMMQLTLFSVYWIMVVSVRDVLCGEEPGTANGAYLCVVVFTSTACVLLSVAMIIMMANKGGGAKPPRQLKNDPESAAESGKPPERDRGGGSGEVAVTRRPHSSGGGGVVPDLASAAREAGFVVLIPDVVNSWMRMRPRSEEKEA